MACLGAHVLLTFDVALLRMSIFNVGALNN